MVLANRAISGGGEKFYPLKMIAEAPTGESCRGAIERRRGSLRAGLLRHRAYLLATRASERIPPGGFLHRDSRGTVKFIRRSIAAAARRRSHVGRHAGRISNELSSRREVPTLAGL